MFAEPRSGRPLLVAEISANHAGSIKRAKLLIKLAATHGADAVKIQSYEADTMTIDGEQEHFKINSGPWKGHTLHSLYSSAQTPFSWHRELFDYAKSVNAELFSTPFDDSAVDLLEELGTPYYKIASFELTDVHLLSKVAKTGKGVIISTGMSSIEDIENALNVFGDYDRSQIILLHATSAYPAPLKDSNLSLIAKLKSRFGVRVGLSDHTLGNEAALAAISLGACLVEKHFTDDRSVPSADSSFSAQPDEFLELAEAMGRVQSALGDGEFTRPDSENESMIFRRSLMFVRDLHSGSIVGKEDIVRMRPGFGLKPINLEGVVGKKLSESVTKGDCVQWSHLEQ